MKYTLALLVIETVLGKKLVLVFFSKYSAAPYQRRSCQEVFRHFI